MIYLYIKTHRVTGLKYFGKTTQNNPFKYKGSGKLWKRHIRKYGYKVDTEIYFECEDINEINQVALRFSKENNIVRSAKWANLIEENGIDGTPTGLGHSKEHRENLSKSRNNSILICKKWKVIDPENNERIVINLNKFCKENNLNQGNMSAVATGRLEKHKGWTCKKLDA